jgi:hypothetical protein
MSIRRSRCAILGLVTCVLCGVQLGCGAETPRARAPAPAESLSSFCTRVEPELRTLGQLRGTAVLRLGELAALERDALRQARSLQLKASGRDRLVKALELELQRLRLAARAAKQAETTESMRAIAVTLRASDRASRAAQRLLREVCAHGNRNRRLD